MVDRQAMKYSNEEVARKKSSPLRATDGSRLKPVRTGFVNFMLILDRMPPIGIKVWKIQGEGSLKQEISSIRT